MDRIKDRLITIILILLIIGIIAGIGFFIYYINNSTVDDKEIATENKALNITNETNENTINLNTTAKEPDGIPYMLENNGTSERNVNNDTAKIDTISISDFSLNTSIKLKEVGYKVELENDNKIVNISSNDGKYSYKLIRLSDKTPQRLTKDQIDELDKICSNQATKACIDQGLTKNSENYKNVYDTEYSKITPEVESVYNKYNINRFSTISGIGQEIINTNLQALGITNIESFEFNQESGSKDAQYEYVYMSKDKKAKITETEISSESGMYNYQGVFLILETYTEENLDDYSVDFNFLK